MKRAISLQGLGHKGTQGLLLLFLGLTTACNASSFSGWQVGSGSGSVALANGSVNLSWSRSGEGVLSVKGQSSFAIEKLYLSRQRNQSLLDQQAVTLDAERRFEVSFRDDPAADGICVESRCLDF